MPYQVKVGSMTAIVGDEQQALEMLRRMTGASNEVASITDIFGSEVDIATLRSRLVKSSSKAAESQSP
jgi:hypothetical protein